MRELLPSPKEIADHYDRLMKDVNGEYVQQRWENSETKRRHYRQTEMALRFALAAVAEPGDTLEIGSGPAVWTTLYLSRARSVRLVDISSEMILQARRRIELWDAGKHADKVSYSCGDFLDTTLPEKCFDTILSSRALEYMRDKPLFVQRCARLLRPGGTLIVITKSATWRDLRQASRNATAAAPGQLSIDVAMQLDLVAPDSLADMFRSAGLGRISTYPVVIGSYAFPLSKGAGLAVADAIHRRTYRRPIAQLPRAIQGWLESFVAIGRKSS